VHTSSDDREGTTVRVTAVQVSDAPAAAADDLVEETMRHRRLPGDGDLDLAGFLRALDRTGTAAPLTVEVLSTDLVVAGPVEAARRAGRATRDLLARAPHG
jgi:sugar phosphate isomerase/epimerase